MNLGLSVRPKPTHESPLGRACFHGSEALSKDGTEQSYRQGHRAVLELHRFGKRETWLLTGYRTPEGADINFDLGKLKGSMFFKTN